MKFIKEVWDDIKQEYITTEISELEAVKILSGYYNNAEDIVRTPSYYRLPYGGIEVKDLKEDREYREFESKNGQYRATWRSWFDKDGNKKTKFEWVDKDQGEGYYLNDIPWTVAYAIIRMGKMKEIGEDEEDV